MKVNKTRRNVFAGLALAAIVGTTGCSAVNPQATTFEYAPSDGTQTTVVADENSDADADVVDFVNIAVITDSADDENGRLIGTIHNKTSSSETVDLQINNESFNFSLDSNEILKLEDEQINVANVGTEPGELASGVASAFGNSNEFHVSILPPSLEEYREIYPGDVDTEQLEHLYEFQGAHHQDDE